jgi:hypothetical protein
MGHLRMPFLLILAATFLWSGNLARADMAAAREQCRSVYKEALVGTYTFTIKDYRIFGVTREGGWTNPAIKKYLGVAQWAAHERELSCLGIPTLAGGEATIFLFDARPEVGALVQFSEFEEPGHTALAPLVRGYMVFVAERSPLNEAAVGFKIGEQRYNDFEPYRLFGKP